MTFKIEKAQRKALPLLAMLYGKSGTGKTYSALKLAQGLLDKPEDRICLIDSENMRASYYSDIFDFDVINIEAPHTPERYMEAFKLAESKYNVIIIDSFSSVWDGEGGILEMVDNESERLQKIGKAGKGLHIWTKPKMKYKRMMNAIMGSRTHKILCCQSKEPIKQVGNKMVNLDAVPICEPKLEYQMLIKFHLMEGGKVSLKSCIMEMIKDKLNITGYLTTEHGNIIKNWLNEGVAVDIRLRNLKRDCRDQALQGVQALDNFFKNLGIDNKKLIAEFADDDFKSEVRRLAEEADLSKKQNEEDETTELNAAQPNPANFKLDLTGEKKKEESKEPETNQVQPNPVKTQTPLTEEAKEEILREEKEELENG